MPLYTPECSLWHIQQGWFGNESAIHSQQDDKFSLETSLLHSLLRIGNWVTSREVLRNHQLHKLWAGVNWMRSSPSTGGLQLSVREWGFYSRRESWYLCLSILLCKSRNLCSRLPKFHSSLNTGKLWRAQGDHWACWVHGFWKLFVETKLHLCYFVFIHFTFSPLQLVCGRRQTLVKKLFTLGLPPPQF